MKVVRKKPPVASKLQRVSSQLDLFDAFGEGSEDYSTIPMLMSYFTASGLPMRVMKDAYMTMSQTPTYTMAFGNLVHWWKDLARGVKTIRTVGKEVIPLTIAEIHRPKIQGCISKYAQSSQRGGNLSISIKIFGVGFGQDVTRTLGFSDEFEITQDCVRLTVPVNVEWEELEFTRGKHKGTRFFQSNVKSIGNEWEPVSIVDSASTGCSVSEDKVRLAKWRKENFRVPGGATWKRTLSVEDSQASEISLETKIAGVQIGPKAIVKYLNKIETSYNLVGPHKYTAYFPKNSLSYLWNWL